jgi:hypothetical protein
LSNKHRYIFLISVPQVRVNLKHMLSGQGIKVILNIYQLARVVKRVAESQVQYIFSTWQIKKKYVPALNTSIKFKRNC